MHEAVYIAYVGYRLRITKNALSTPLPLPPPDSATLYLEVEVMLNAVVKLRQGKLIVIVLMFTTA